MYPLRDSFREEGGVVTPAGVIHVYVFRMTHLYSTTSIVKQKKSNEEKKIIYEEEDEEKTRADQAPASSPSGHHPSLQSKGETQTNRGPQYIISWSDR